MQFPSNDSGIDSKNFLKLKDKESAVGVFRGDPHNFRQHWVSNRSQPCQGEGCQLCVDKNKAGFRFRLNFISKTPSGYEAKIFEQGWIVYEQLRALHEGDYKLDKTIVRITRNGTGFKDTSYTVIPIPKFDVSPDTEKQLSGIKLHDLANLAKEGAPEPGAFDRFDNVPPPTDSDIPF